MDHHKSAIFLALSAVVFITADLRKLATVVALLGIAMLVWDNNHTIPSIHSRRKCQNRFAPKPSDADTVVSDAPAVAEDKKIIDVPMTEDEYEEDPFDDMEMEGYIPEPIDPELPPEEDNDNDLTGIVYGEHFSGPSYITRAREGGGRPNAQELMRPRLGVPSRDRMQRLEPVVTHSAYRDRTGQMCRFSHLH